ncbi:DinB family protein [Roseivirga sp.]|uniref:DinB family protein n=1 Tax=Roseivirga sp. TaxID=1964215 RepID=UPI003B52878D
MRYFLMTSLLLATILLKAQNKTDYYYEIPEYPGTYNAGTVMARMVDGLGFRYYWATAGLTSDNLSYKANEDGRTMAETLDHIWSLSRIVMNAIKGEPTTFDVDLSRLNFEEKRNQTLEFIKTASETLKKSDASDFENFDMIFKYPDGNSREYPVWNVLNGPLSDALWHVGQVVLMRRGAGNPFSSNVGVLEGTVREN